MLLRCFLAFAIAAAANGQWINYKDPGLPRTEDGKPNLAAPAPRMNWKPDFTGIWRTDPSAAGEIEKLLRGIGVPEVPGDEPTTFPKYFLTRSRRPAGVRL